MKATRFLALIVAAVICFNSPLALPIETALAEDCFTLNVDTLDMDSLRNEDYVARRLSSQSQGIQIVKYISNSNELAARVRLTLLQADTKTLIFDKDYGYQSGTFFSDIIYLPYVGDRTVPYLVTLYIESMVYALPFYHLKARLHSNGACTYGVRLRDLDAALGSDWQMGTMLDLNDLAARGSMTVPICASNAYIIGQATINAQDGFIWVSLSFLPQANVELREASVYVVTDCLSGYLGAPHAVGDWIDVSGFSSALIYLPMNVSYDAVSLSGFGYDLNSPELNAQLALWNRNRGTRGAENDAYPDGGWTDDQGGWIDAPTGQTDGGWIDTPDTDEWVIR